MSSEHGDRPRDRPGDRPGDGPARGGLTLTWLGHSTVVIELAGLRLLTDPLLRRRIGALVGTGAAPAREHWAGPDAILLSHLHHDHADPASLRKLGDTPVVTGPRNQRWVRRLGMTAVDIAVDDWWTVPRASPGSPVAVRLVPAIHRSRRMPHRPNDAHGFLIRSPDAAVYFAGDTALYEQMSSLSDLAGRPIDVALLPIGGWGPVLSDGHLGPETAAEAAALIGASEVLPIHYGTLHPVGWPRRHRAWMHKPLPAFAAALGDLSPSITLCAPPPGQAVHVTLPD